MKLFKMRKDGTGLEDIAAECSKLSGKPMTVVEVGSYAGESMEIFTRTGLVKTIFCIDPWKAGWDKNDPASSTDLEHAEQKFDERAQASVAEVIKHKGTLDDFVLPDNAEVDLVYVDSCHKYEECRHDLLVALDKLKPKIAIAGHDYSKCWKEVIRAVDEVVGKPDRVFGDSSWMKYMEKKA